MATPKEPKPTDALAVQRTNLAVERNILAAERTLMGWIRTSLAMIGFGFSIGTLGDQLAAMASGTANPDSNQQPAHVLGISIAMVVLGTAALTVATIQHVGILHELGAGIWRPRMSLATIVSFSLILLGIVAAELLRRIL
jgi:putative membrane protein